MDIVLARQLGADRFKQGGCTKGWRVVGIAFANGRKARFGDMRRRVKIGFTTGQIDNIKTGGFFLAPLLHHHRGGRGGDSLDQAG